MLTTTIWGGAGEHGRSCYHVERNGISVLLDCGVKKSGTGEYPKLDATRIRELSTVFLSHAHEDHSIGIPLLYELGYCGVVWTTRATVSQLPSYFAQWSNYVNRHGGKLPYGADAVDRISYRYLEDVAAAGTWFEAAPGVKVCWGPSGHLPGSVWLLLDIGGKRLFYSGDYTNESSLLRADLPNLQDANVPDVAIIDAAYGKRSEVQEQEVDQLITKIRDVIVRRGHVLLPVPMYGRGQELMVLISEKIPEAKLVCESLLVQGFRDLKTHAEWLWPGSDVRIQQAMRRVKVVNTEAERAATLAGPPAVLFTPDGLMESPVAQSYYYQLCDASRHAVLFTGHLYEGSFGAKVYQAYSSVCGEQSSLVDKQEAGEAAVSCEIMQFHYKIHQGLPDVSRMLQAIRPKHALLVHASKEQTDMLCARLSDLGYSNLHSLCPGDRIQV